MVKWNRFIRNTAGALAMAIAITSMAAGSGFAVYADTEGTVNADLLNVRSGPSTNDSVITMISKDTKITIISSEDGWYKISINGTTGYVMASYVTVSGTSSSDVAGSVGIVNTGTLNVRKGAGTDTQSLGYIYSGTQVSILGSEGEWYKVSVKVNGTETTGYVHSDYITIGSSSSNSGANNNTSTDVSTAGKAGICDVSALNIRSSANTQSTIKGVLHSGDQVTIVETSGEWYKIKATVNGKSVEGYVFAEYIKVSSSSSSMTNGSVENVQGNDSQTLPSSGKVATGSTSLNVRSSASMTASIVGSINNGTSVTILAKEGDWYKVKVTINGNEVTGYVYATYISTSGDNSSDSSDSSNGQTVNETVWTLYGVNVRKGPGTSYASLGGLAKGSAVVRTSVRSDGWSQVKYGTATGYIRSDLLTTTNPNPSSSEVTGAAVVQYALQFEGNPYVYGGNDLVNGVDCSGFTQQVYKHFGISINRTADSQRSNGIVISSIDEAQPGDLVFYGSGGWAGHVALYIGNGKVIHASSPSVGIIISNVNYRTPMQINRIIY